MPCCGRSSTERSVADRRWLPWVGLAIRLVAAGIWLVAGVAKALDFTAFQQQISAYDVLPGGLVTPVGYLLPLGEIALGGYLLLGVLVRPAAVVSTVLMAVFIAAQAQAWARGLVIDCGCFGTTDLQRVGAGTIARDLLLAVPAAILAVRPARHLSVDQAFLGGRDEFSPPVAAATPNARTPA
jgi:uncharacterized membrane protein YphA (DoxX/SURF4 family)